MLYLWMTTATTQHMSVHMAHSLIVHLLLPLEGNCSRCTLLRLHTTTPNPSLIALSYGAEQAVASSKLMWQRVLMHSCHICKLCKLASLPNKLARPLHWLPNGSRTL